MINRAAQLFQSPRKGKELRCRTRDAGNICGTGARGTTSGAREIFGLRVEGAGSWRGKCSLKYESVTREHGAGTAGQKE
jgi:hypothetical protein